MIQMEDEKHRTKKEGFDSYGRGMVPRMEVSVGWGRVAYQQPQ